MIIKCIMSIILIIISGMMTFGLNENFKNLDENGSIVCMLLIAITYIITIIIFKLHKVSKLIYKLKLH